MALASCPRCKKLFDKSQGNVCLNCQPLEDDDYERVREALQTHPEHNAEQLAEAKGIDVQCIVRFLQSGRLETQNANKKVRCGRCGAPAISLSKKLCEACLQRLNSELAAQQSQMRLNTQKSAARKRPKKGGAGKENSGKVIKFKR